MSRFKCSNYAFQQKLQFPIGAIISYIFILKMTAAVFAETLYNFQNSMLLIPEE
jgi:hypothetical protein